MRATTRLKNMVSAKEIVVAPGAFDGLSARLVEQAGFPAIYASGGAIARSTGKPRRATFRIIVASSPFVSPRTGAIIAHYRRPDHPGTAAPGPRAR